MTQAETPSFMKQVRQEWHAAAQWLDDSWRQTGIWVRNQIRQLQDAQIDYVVLPLGGSLPERAPMPRSFWQRQLPIYSDPPMSFQELNHILQRVGDADNVKGVLFLFTGFSAGLGTLQNFRRAIQRLRERGKKVVVYTPYLDLPHYFAAAGADHLLAPPSASFDVLGLRTSVAFLKDSLALAGIQFDIIQISPYKSAYDRLGKADITPELQAQLNWLLDEQYDLLTAGMAEGRGKTQAEMKAILDQAPLYGDALCQQGVVDALVYEDELVYWLAEKPQPPSTSADLVTVDATTPDPESRPQAKLVLWSEAEPLLQEKFRRTTPKFIGVVSLEGAIMPGESRNPPIDLPIPLIGGDSAGDITLSRLLRQAEEQEEMAALIFHVDSPGGSALASDLIGRQIERIAKKKPVLVYMGNVAASGGYYVSAAANHIMAQTGTITGSIGVISARLSTSELENRLRVNRVNLKRGEHADLFSGETPLTAEEHDLLQQGIQAIYHQFKEVVARGRDLPYDKLDPICEGRVWTGRQALAHKLVDSHGDFADAILQAATLAGLPTDTQHQIRTLNFYDRSKEYRLPHPYEATVALLHLFTQEHWQVLSGKPLMLLPFTVKPW
ncbi:MAG: signal peptide peptidase SppA [Chloroflexi bacterium]|nr:signal peptide peptidase SppA [Chloroflexota bacterium]MBP8058574.1 signal peptide peptidase SppA [Chloroflexota bacterium]